MIDLSTHEPPATRILHYCHDTFGLGHIRRTLCLADAIRGAMPDATQLIVTGSAVAHDFRFPEGTDYIKLPSVTKDRHGGYAPRSLSSEFDAIRDMRRDILLNAATHFQPDIFIVDHAPAGLKGEVVDTLRYLRANCPDTRLVLGLRDIVDEAATVRKTWAREGVYQLLDELYDQILVYGDSQVHDLIAEYGLSPVAASKTRYVGYLGRSPGTRSPGEVRASLKMQTDRLVVVTAGGGGDGAAVFETLLQGLDESEREVEFDCLLIGGHLMDPEARRLVRELAAGRPNVHVLDSTNDMASYLGAADAVISMGGYNTMCEIVSLRRPAIIVPRVTPRQEQLIRARLFHRLGLVQMIHPHHLTPDRLLHETRALLNGGQPDVPPISMDGLVNVTATLGALLPMDLEQTELALA